MKLETLSENTCFVSSLIKNYMCKAGLQYLLTITVQLLKLGSAFACTSYCSS